MDLETDARFRCPKCGENVAANVLLPELPPKAESTFAGGEIVIVTCPSCETAFKARAFYTPSMCSLTFIDHPEDAIIACPPMVRDVDDELDAWLYDTPADPYAIFNASVAEARVLLDQHGGDGASLVNRMVFANYIGAFEAFLADTLANEVLPNEAALKRLIERDEPLRNRRFSLVQIAATPDLIKNAVRERLQSEVWHRMKRAAELYVNALGIDIRNLLGAQADRVDEAIAFRHDCVHRNGRDKDGVQLTVFTKEYVIEIGVILSQLAHDIVKAINESRAEWFFAPDKSESM
jgi:uncharacterized C2H2 Zn-finger protein